MKTVAIVIARTGSTRLPGKVLSDLDGIPVLAWVVEAAAAAIGVDEVWVATTTETRDDAIERWCRDGGYGCCRGSEDDVLDRVARTAAHAGADIVIRLTADCPFLDSNVIGEVIRLRQTLGVDYASNIHPPTWPDGLDTECFTFKALDIARREATSRIDRECVTSFITDNQHRFSTANLTCPIPGLHKSRWVLDTENDQGFMRLVAKQLPSHRPSYLDILKVLDKWTELTKINHHHPRNERYYAALSTEPLPPRNFSKSKELLERAEKTIPLGAQTFSKSKIQYPADSPLFLTHGDGGYCFDVDGNRYVDLVGGLLPVILGHRDPDVDEAVRRQLDKGVCFSLATELEAELSETLCRLIPCAEMCRFGKNGTDVTTAAVRLARAYTGRKCIVSSGYHGWNDWSVAHDPVRNNGVTDGVKQDIIPLRHDDTDSLYSLRGHGDIAAIIVEPETKPIFLLACRQFCNDIGALLIYDEIITGFRFHLGGAQALYGDVVPDLACFGKCMGNGYPISALVGRRKYMSYMENISFSGTFFGDAIGLAASIATIKKLEQENVLTKIYDNQCTLLGDLMGTLTHRVPGPVIKLTGEMHLPRLVFGDNYTKTIFIREMAQNGVLIIASHNLSYAHGPNELKRIVSAYDNALEKICDALKKGEKPENPIPARANVRASA